MHQTSSNHTSPPKMTATKILLCWIFLFQRLLAVPITTVATTDSKAGGKKSSSEEAIVKVGYLKDDMVNRINNLESASSENKSTEDINFKQGFVNSLRDLLKEKDDDDTLIKSLQDFMTRLKIDQPIQNNLPQSGEKDEDVVFELEELKSPLNSRETISPPTIYSREEIREESKEVLTGSTLFNSSPSQTTSPEEFITESGSKELFSTLEENVSDEVGLSTRIQSNPSIPQNTAKSGNDILDQVPRALLNWRVASKSDHELLVIEYDMMMKIYEVLNDIEEKLNIGWKPKRQQEISVSDSLKLGEVWTDGDGGLSLTPDASASDTLEPKSTTPPLNSATASLITSGPSVDSLVTHVSEANRNNSKAVEKSTLPTTSSQLPSTVLVADGGVSLSNSENSIAKEEEEKLIALNDEIEGGGGESKELLGLRSPTTIREYDPIENELKQANQDNLVNQLNKVKGEEWAAKEEAQGNETVNKSRIKGKKPTDVSYKGFQDSVDWLKKQYERLLEASTSSQ